MKPGTRFRLGAGILFAGAFVACAFDPLNPQPLPPSQSESAGPNRDSDSGPPYTPAEDAGAFGEGSDGGVASSPAGDAAAPDASEDGGDAGTDAGDAGDGAVN